MVYYYFIFFPGAEQKYVKRKEILDVDLVWDDTNTLENH